MIKSLFDEADEKDQNDFNEIKQPETEIKNTLPPNENALPEFISVNETEIDNLFEIRPIEDIEGKRLTAISPDVNDAEPIINFTLSNPFEPATAAEKPKSETDEPLLFQMQSKPESTAETARKTGLAMSAAIALFGSVVFLLIIGWFVDLLLGTSPWGIVSGIVLGSIIGFFQFFRMTSQILKNKD